MNLMQNPKAKETIVTESSPQRGSPRMESPALYSKQNLINPNLGLGYSQLVESSDVKAVQTDLGRHRTLFPLLFKGAGEQPYCVN